MNDTIRTLISQYEEPGDFTYAKVTDIELELAEKELKLTLPTEYVEFLKSYGHGGICGCCTDGIGLDGSSLRMSGKRKCSHQRSTSDSCTF